MLAESRATLLNEIENIRSGEAVAALSWLWGRMDFNSSRWTKTNLEKISTELGPEIADAARTGFKRFWRTWTPSLPHEKEKPNETDNRVGIGLTGIAMEVEDGLDAALLSAQEVATATAYAANELNGFPDWIVPLAEHHPTAVTSVLSRCVQGEWGRQSADGGTPEIIGRLGHDPPAIRDLIAPEVMAHLETGDPTALSTLRAALRVVRRGETVDRARWAALAGARSRAVIDDRPRLMTWLPVWLTLDGGAAVSFLEATAAALEPGDGTALVREFCSAYRDQGDFPFTVSGLPNEVSALVRLIDLLFRHTRPAEDM